MALGGKGSERVRLSGQWRPDPESRSVVSKDWAKWKGRGPNPGTGKNVGGGIRGEPWRRMERSKGMGGGQRLSREMHSKVGQRRESALTRVQGSSPSPGEAAGLTSQQGGVRD